MIRILLLVMFAALLLTNPSVPVRKADAASTDANATQSHAGDRRAESSAPGGGRHVPARDTRVRSSSPTRPVSLRWHSFLPGMFR